MTSPWCRIGVLSLLGVLVVIYMTGNPKMESVSSANISEIGYDTGERILYVKFRSGGEYRYHEVPQSVYDGLRAASSAGKYLFNNVSGVYPMRRA